MAYVCLGALNLRKISTGYLPNTGTVKPTHPNKLGRWASWVNHPMLGMIIDDHLLRICQHFVGDFHWNSGNGLLCAGAQSGLGVHQNKHCGPWGPLQT